MVILNLPIGRRKAALHQPMGKKKKTAPPNHFPRKRKQLARSTQKKKKGRRFPSVITPG